MTSKIISGILFTIGLVLAIGTAGASDLNNIGGKQIVIQLSVSVVLMLMAYIIHLFQGGDEDE